MNSQLDTRPNPKARRAHLVAGLSPLLGQLAEDSDDAYLASHCATSAAIGRRVDVFLRYEDYVVGDVLDWGCRHAPDACLMRIAGNVLSSVSGCDVEPAGSYRITHDFARLSYTRLTHHSMLPYDSSTFDTIIGSGTLEHVPQESASLTELWRVLRPGGRFIITFLPNALSLTERGAAAVGKDHHARLYTRSLIKSLLLRHGFLPILHAYHQFMPSLAGAAGHCSAAAERRPAPESLARLQRSAVDLVWPLNGPLERLWPTSRFCANHLLIAQKVPTL